MRKFSVCLLTWAFSAILITELLSALIIQSHSQQIQIHEEDTPKSGTKTLKNWLHIETIKSTLASGEEVLVSGFGKFCVNDKKEGRGKNPATGDSMMLKPRRRVVTFKCSGKLRRRVNGA